MIVKKIKYGITFRKMTNLGNPDNDISGIIMREKDRQTVEAICRHLALYSKNWDLIEINELPAENLESNALNSMFQKTGYYTMVTKDIHYYLPITSDWQTYFDQLPHNLRGYLNNHLKKVKKSGELIYKVFNGGDLTWDHFLTMFKINEHSRFAFLYQPEYEQAFTRELFELTQGQDWVEVDILYLNDQPIAFNFGFNMAGRHEGWRMGYDGQFHKHGPGKLLSMHLMENIFNRGFKEFDFLRGLESYKKEWEPINREFIHLRAVKINKLIPTMFFIWLPRLHELWIKWTAIFRRDKQTESP
jgi:CelD/BcsL family acetyltransferase involved in cellulose biosynthesis